MAKVKVTVTLPTQRNDGSAVPPTDISGVGIEQKLASAPVSAWSALGPDLVPGAASTSVSLDVNNVPAGNWIWRATIHDKLGGPDLQAVSSPLNIALSPISSAGFGVSGQVIP